MNAVLKNNEIEKLREYIGGDMYEMQEKSPHICIPLEDKAYLISFRRCDLEAMSKKEERVTVYCSGKDFLLFSNSLKLPAPADREIEPFKMLILFFDMLTENDTEFLNSLEDELSELENELIISPKLQKGTSAQIVIFRRSLLKLKKYYEQLSTAADILALDEAGAVPESLKSGFAGLSHKIDRLENDVAHLREYVTQVREAYQAQIDIEQNQIMKIFTVLTAVFLPLSLIVGWYGMNFSMPEYKWRFGYLFVIIFSIAVCCFAYWFFKKRKWF